MRQTEIERLLPAVFRRTVRDGSLLDGLLAAMEAAHAPAERVLDGLDAYFDPRRAPDAFVPFLARWVDLERLLVDDPDDFATTPTPAFSSGYGHLRELVVEAAYLSRWRGTARGLLRFLEVATGVQGFAIEELPFHVRVRVPHQALPHRALIWRIIESEKPAYVTFEMLEQTLPAT